MSKIQATVVADSKSPQGHRLTSLEIVFPRIILSEKNTHRALSKNLSSSRAIPFKRMLKTILQDPFIPIAFQKEHTGMQGTEYHNPEAKFNINDAVAYIYQNVIIGDASTKEDMEYNAQIMKLVSDLAIRTYPMENTLVGWWLTFRDLTAMCATLLYSFKVTKQLANRLLEPFMWAKALVSGTDEGWENFFNLRCPDYVYRNMPEPDGYDAHFRSRKDLIAHVAQYNPKFAEDSKNISEIEWLKINKGQAEIHMMALAEAIWDAMNESKPKELKVGDWHIPYGDKIDLGNPVFYLAQGSHQADKIVNTNTVVKVSTGMAAITSYTVVGDGKEKPYQTLIGIHDKMLNSNPMHSSPFEHTAQVPTQKEYDSAVKGNVNWIEVGQIDACVIDRTSLGWFRNYHGFKQYRQIIEDGKANT